MDKRYLTILLITLALAPALEVSVVAPQASAFPYNRNDQEISRALTWLRNSQELSGMIGSFAHSSWAAMAIAASEDDPNGWSRHGYPSLVQYLQNNVGLLSSCSDYSRFILSMVAADIDPKNVSGIDLVARLETYYNSGQFGDPELLSDDYWAIMALISAGIYKTDTRIQSAVNFIKSHQHDSGGWSYDTAAAYGPDIDDTAAAIMALISAGEQSTSDPIINGLAYIKSRQVENGGFDGGWGVSAETNSWAIQAIISAGQNVTGPEWRHSSSGKTPIDSLLTFQNLDGGFKDYTGNSNVLTTSYAISALIGKPYPIITGARTTIRIEGQFSTIWKGEVFTTWSNITEATPIAGRKHYYGQPTIIGALDKATKAAGFTYIVDYTYGSVYVKAINGEEAAGLNGWLFRVNNRTTGSYSCDAYILNKVSPPDPPHKDIIWYYGGWGDKVLGIAADRTIININDSITVTVTYLNETTNEWIPVSGASVWAAEMKYSTNSTGKVSIRLSSSGTYDIYANKTGYVRSDRIQVKVNATSSSELKIEANIIPALALIVNPTSINFGTVGPNMTSIAHSLDLSNYGSLNAEVTVTVADLNSTNVFHDCLQMSDTGTTNWNSWASFRKTLAGHNGQQPGTASIYVRLNIPRDYPVTPGNVKGKITFWLEPK
ncbi:MAG: hypothetical protein ACUVTM_07250 [Candidatus Bathyarchaeia archaeon]